MQSHRPIKINGAWGPPRLASPPPSILLLTLTSSPSKPGDLPSLPHRLDTAILTFTSSPPLLCYLPSKASPFKTF